MTARNRPHLLFLAALAVNVSYADATTLRRVSAADRVRQSDLIVEGVVSHVDHRNSDVAGPEHVSLPHTFVTIAIERVFKGSSTAGDSITLRLQGGPDGTGRTYVVAGIPRFAPGDRDILFIRRNGESMCPLVGWEQGRLRIVRGQVYDVHGRETWVASDGGFLFGDRRIDVRAFPYLPVEERALVHEPRRAFVPPAGALRPDAAGLRGLLARMAADPSLRGGRRGPARSVRVGEPFFVRAPRPVPPPPVRRQR